MIRTRLQGDTPFFPNMLNNGKVEICLKEDVDKAIEEKDAEIASLKAENESLKAKLDTVNELVKTSKDLYDHTIESLKASHYADSVDAGMRERRLRRLLWHAIALFCARSCEYFSGIMSHCLMGQDDLYRRCEEKKNKYIHATYKCRAKAEEYK